MLNTRGKSVVAEATIPDELFQQSHALGRASSCTGPARSRTSAASCPGVNNNGSHSANGITAMFIATGQDAANVAESSAAFVYAELLPNGDYYYSVTIPSLIVATYGGGTGLPPSASAWSCSAATARARCGSSPRSSPPRCSAASSRWARRSSPRSGWTRTICTVATASRLVPPSPPRRPSWAARVRQAATARAANEVQDQRRARHRDDDPGCTVTPYEPHDDAGGEVAGQTEKDRLEDRHRIGSGQRQARQRTDEEAGYGEDDEVEQKSHRSERIPVFEGIAMGRTDASFAPRAHPPHWANARA